MFKPFLLLATFLGVFSYSTAHAAISLQLDPTNGAISGLPGTTIGWGFTLTNTEKYLVVTSAVFDASTSLGVFTDFISAPDNFFVVGPAPGASNVWAQAFNAATQTGIGSFAIDAGTTQSSVAYGEIVLTYDLFAVSPLDPNFNPDTNTLSNGNMLTANASVNAIVPLPGAIWLFGAGMAGALGLCKKYRRVLN